MKSIKNLEMHLKKYKDKKSDFPTYEELIKFIEELKDRNNVEYKKEYLDGLVSKKEVEDHKAVLLKWKHGQHGIYIVLAALGIFLLLNTVFQWIE